MSWWALEAVAASSCFSRSGSRPDASAGLRRSCAGRDIGADRRAVGLEPATPGQGQGPCRGDSRIQPQRPRPGTSGGAVGVGQPDRPSPRHRLLRGVAPDWQALRVWSTTGLLFMPKLSPRLARCCRASGSEVVHPRRGAGPVLTAAQGRGRTPRLRMAPPRCSRASRRPGIAESRAGRHAGSAKAKSCTADEPPRWRFVGGMTLDISEKNGIY
jgi:hypothetical protein